MDKKDFAVTLTVNSVSTTPHGNTQQKYRVAFRKEIWPLEMIGCFISAAGSMTTQPDFQLSSKQFKHLHKSVELLHLI